MLAPVFLAASLALGIDVLVADDHSFPMAALSYVEGDGVGPDFELHVSTVGIGSLVDLGVRNYVGTTHVRPFFSVRLGGVVLGVIPVIPTLTAVVGLAMGGDDSTAFEVEVGATAGAVDDSGLVSATRVSLAFRF